MLHYKIKSFLIKNQFLQSHDREGHTKETKDYKVKCLLTRPSHVIGYNKAYISILCVLFNPLICHHAALQRHHYRELPDVCKKIQSRPFTIDTLLSLQDERVCKSPSTHCAIISHHDTISPWTLVAIPSPFFN